MRRWRWAGPGGLIAALLTLAATSPGVEEADLDPRTAYDVHDYRIDLLVDPEARMIRGFAGLSASITAPTGLAEVVLDLDRRLGVQRVGWVSDELFTLPAPQTESVEYRRDGDLLTVTAPEPLQQGDRFALVVHYSGTPRRLDDFTGFHFAETPSGQPWLSTSCQTIGAHTWFPCKAAYFHPADKNERLLMNITVPRPLYAACNGNLEEITEAGNLRTFRWRNEYPQPTYSIAMSIGPYEVLEDEVQLPGQEQPLQLRYYVLPEDRERALLQFAEVPELLRFYHEVFGDYPFPAAKFGLAQTPFWGMEHSTIIAYGNSFPAALAQEGRSDPFQTRNKYYDYILVHESAHEWWGNAISSANWGDFWLHEGFATYAEALWVEHQRGPNAYLDFMDEVRRAIDPATTVYRPYHTTAGSAYHEILYEKGAFFLHMLRYVMGDEAFFDSVKQFAMDPRFRYRTASTRDYRQVCESLHGESLRGFFQAWLYGSGWPRYQVREAKIEGNRVTLEIQARSRSQFPFDMPLDVELICKDGSVHARRLPLGPGTNQHSLEAPHPVQRVEYPGFRWILCDVRHVP